MVSSAFITPQSTTVTSKGKCRILHLDYSKDYGKSLHVETSVEYDLPSHIYPPKGSEPILMIQSACQTSSKPVEKKCSVKPLPHSPLGLVNNKSRPLAALQLHSNHTVVRNTKKTNRSAGVSGLCSNLHCNHCNLSKPTSAVQEIGNILNDTRLIKPRSKVPDNIFYNPVNSLLYSTNVKTLRHREIQQKSQVEKQLQAQQEQLVLQQQQLSLQAQQQIQLGLEENARLQAQKSTKAPRQQIFSEQLEQVASWNVADSKCQGICCRGNDGVTQSSIPTSQSTFVAPSLPLSLLARTPSRGSPKVRSRSRRGISIAGSANLPEYIGAARTIRTTAIGAEGLNRTQIRSSADITVPGVPIITSTGTGASNLELGLALGTVFTSTPVARSLYQNINQVGVMPSSAGTTLEQNKDITAALNAEKVSVNSSNRLELDSYTTNTSRLKSLPTNVKSVKGLWSMTDTRYGTTVDISADAIFTEPFNSFPSNGISTNPHPTMLIQNESTNTALSWMKHFTGPLHNTLPDRSGLNSLFFHHQTNSTYMPQSIWNLAY